MIKEGIIIGGLAFYIFVVTTLVGDIRTSLTTQETRTSPSLSSESSTMTKMESSLAKK